MPGARSLVYGRYSLGGTLWSARGFGRKGSPPRTGLRLALVFLGHLLLYVLPGVAYKPANGWCVHFLTLHLGVVTGPYTCAYCGRATTNGPNLTCGRAAYCWRRSCQAQADGFA